MFYYISLLPFSNFSDHLQKYVFLTRKYEDIAFVTYFA